MVLKNPKHERFALALADGETQDEAYVIAGYKRNRGNAARLNADENILTRVREIMEARRQRSDVTKETMTRRLNEAIERADKRESDSAVSAMLNTLCKMHGLITEKHRVETVDTMEEDELAAEQRRIDNEIAELEAAKAGGGSPPKGVVTH